MKSPRNGFTLIELLLTLGVLAIGLTSIFALLPGVTELSRELRDEDRVRTFVDAAFTSVAWSLEESSEPENATAVEKMSFYHVLGTQELVTGSTEISWPEGAENLVPVLFYTLQIQTTAVHQVEVTLQVRPQTETGLQTYTRILYPQVRAW